MRTSHALKLVATALLIATSQAALAQPQAAAPASASPAGPFTLDALPYQADALAPVIDKETMELHWGRHHRAYVDNLNRAVTAETADPAHRAMSLEQLLAKVSTLPKSIRDNGGGHWNHRFFWSLMAPEGQRGQPSVPLLAAIERDFGSLDKFKSEFQQAGASQFGSGWAWLIVKPDGKLAVTATPNQDNPLMDLAPVKGQPILGNDVWEHAYYLTYRNRRADYLSSWWQVVNWGRVNELFAQATAKR